MSTKLSYYSTPITEPYIYQTLPDRLRHLAEENPDKEAFVCYNLNRERISLSRKDLHERSLNLARYFVKRGLRKGNPVAFCMNNSIEMLIANMAVVCAGGVPFYMASNLKDGSDISEMMRHMQCVMLVIDTNGHDGNWTILENIWPQSSTESAHVMSLKHVICNGIASDKEVNRLSLATLLESDVKEAIAMPLIQPEDIVHYFCTSGSTGTPKIVKYTHFGLLNFTKQEDIALNLTKDSRYFSDRTFSWVLGYPRTYLTDGATRVFVDPRISLPGTQIDYLCDVIEHEKCDVALFPGYLVSDLSNNRQYLSKLKHVRYFIFCGERVRRSHLFLKAEINKTIIILYGTTEVGSCLTFTSDNIDDYEDGIVGKPNHGMECKIIDENGSVVPVGESGQLCARSTWRFSGYRDQENLFREIVDSGNWFQTGDVCHMREDGNIVLEGRMKEVISTHAHMFFPWPIEQTLQNCPGAQHAIAVGVPDERLYQVVCACIVPKAGAALTVDDVNKFCDSAFLEQSTGFGVTIKPRYSLIFDALPLTGSGKIDRRVIGLIAKERLGL